MVEFSGNIGPDEILVQVGKIYPGNEGPDNSGTQDKGTQGPGESKDTRGPANEQMTDGSPTRSGKVFHTINGETVDNSDGPDISEGIHIEKGENKIIQARDIDGGITFD